MSIPTCRRLIGHRKTTIRCNNNGKKIKRQVKYFGLYVRLKPFKLKVQNNIWNGFLML